MFKKHRPPHLYFSKQIYFLTVRCFNHQNYFCDKQNLVFKIICDITKKFKYGLYGWVILENHLHLLLRVKDDFNKFIKILNGNISFQINQSDNIKERKVIYQYWDHCIRNEADFWKHFNYIHHNPVKHNYCKTQKEAFAHPFSSAREWSKIKGEEWLESIFEFYPIVDFTAGE